MLQERLPLSCVVVLFMILRHCLLIDLSNYVINDLLITKEMEFNDLTVHVCFSICTVNGINTWDSQFQYVSCM